MPRGKRVVPSFDANTPEQAAVAATGAPVAGFVGSDSGPVAEKNVPKSAPMAEKVIVNTGTTVEDLVRLDSEGASLIFEQTDSFLPLDEAVVEQLSRTNRLRYSIAKEFHDSWRGDEHAQFVKRFSVDRQNVGSATDKLTINAGPNVHVRWTRPDLVDRRTAQGYHVLSADEARSYLGSKAGHHEVSVAGQTQLVAMGIPKELFDQRQKEKTLRNNATAGAWRSVAREINQSGGQAYEPLDESADRGHHWSELAQEDS